MRDMTKSGRVMVSIKESTKKELMKIGHMGDSFDKVINDLIDDWNKHHK